MARDKVFLVSDHLRIQPNRLMPYICTCIYMCISCTLSLTFTPTPIHWHPHPSLFTLTVNRVPRAAGKEQAAVESTPRSRCCGI